MPARHFLAARDISQSAISHEVSKMISDKQLEANRSNAETG